MVFNKIYFSLIFLIVTLKIVSQDDYANDNQMRYEDWNYKSYIQTVQLHESSFEANPAILKFNADEQLELSFDDLEADKKPAMGLLKELFRIKLANILFSCNLFSSQ